MKHARRSRYGFAKMFLAVGAMIFAGGIAGPAYANAPDQPSVVDPEAYAGPLVVATEAGDILVEVSPGEAAEFLDRADGRLESLSVAARRIVADAGVDLDSGLGVNAVDAECNVWQREVATPFVYMPSLDGCAVVGYPGYSRPYRWQNWSSVTVCVQGRGWAPGETWRSIGCSGDGGSTIVPWGNSIAYTKVKAMSVSGATGAAYNWLT
jgi:hypothetical protein